MIEHISDIDYISWRLINIQRKLMKAMTELQKLLQIFKKNKDDMRKMLENTVQLNEAKIESLKKKVQFTYLMSSCLAVLVIIELVVLIMKVN